MALGAHQDFGDTTGRVFKLPASLPSGSPLQPAAESPDALYALLDRLPVRRPTVLWDEHIARAEFARAAELPGFGPTVARKGGA